MVRENIESNDSEDDAVGRSNEDDDADSEDPKERNESPYNDGSLLMSNYEEIHIKRKHLAHFNIKDQRPYFNLGMTFANVVEVREVALKFVKNERNRIRVKCQD